jgi:hypothetical protein
MTTVTDTDTAVVNTTTHTRRYSTILERRKDVRDYPTLPTTADAMFNLTLKFLYGKSVPITFTNDTGYSIMGTRSAGAVLDAIDPGVQVTMDLPRSVVYYTPQSLPSADPFIKLTEHERYEHPSLGPRFVFVRITISIAFVQANGDVAFQPYQFTFKIEQSRLHRLRKQNLIESVPATLIASQHRSAEQVRLAIKHLNSLSHVPQQSVQYQNALKNVWPYGMPVDTTRRL